MSSELSKKLKELFRKFDSDQSATISKDKLRSVLQALNPSFTQEELDTLFNIADKNQDGVIQYEEFLDFVCFLDPHNSFRRTLEQEIADETAFIHEVEVGTTVKEYLDRLNKIESANSKPTTDGYSTSRDKADGPDGYVLPVPYTREGAVGLMNHFVQNGLKKPLHISHVNKLLDTFIEKYSAHHPKPVVEVGLPEGENSSFIVVGDTHGQLADVLCIFNSHGVPSKENVFLFNGDIADRGQASVEIFLLLMAFYLAEPSSVLINRGNHENEDMNSLDSDMGGGFIDEVKNKYGLKMYKKFYECFKVLPLATIIGGQYFVVHGGISTGRKALTIDFLKTIKHQECTMPKPTATAPRDKVFCDLLWSDPIDKSGCYPSHRGVGVNFGPDVTASFLDANGLRCMIRSHQLPDNTRGFMKQKGNRCITIFSASNYCGDAGNYGAVLNFKVSSFPNYEINEHFAPPLDVLSRSRQSISSWSKLGEDYEKDHRDTLDSHRQSKELERLAWAIVEHKPNLFKELNDMGAGAAINMGQWFAICNKILGAHFPYDAAVKAWGLQQSDGHSITIQRFLHRFSVKLNMENYESLKGQAIMNVFESIVSQDLDIQQTIRTFDENGDGMVDVRELRQLLSGLDLGLTTPQLESLIRSFFDVRAPGGPASGSSPRVGGSPRGSAAPKRRSSVGTGRRGSLGAGQTGEGRRGSMGVGTGSVGTGSVGTGSCGTGSKGMNKKGTFEKKPTDPADNMKISVDEFLDRFVVVYKQTDDLHAASWVDQEKSQYVADILATVARLIMTTPASELKPGVKSYEIKGTGKLRLLFEALDTSTDGLLQIDEFVDGIVKIPGFENIHVDGENLTRESLLECADFIDSSKDGTINYLEFLKTFSIEDQHGTLADLLAENITVLLYRNRQAIRSACRTRDKNDKGKVSQEEFHAIVEGVNAAVSRPERQLTPLQVDLIVDAVAKDKLVDYEQFIQSFELCDSDPLKALHPDLMGQIKLKQSNEVAVPLAVTS